VTVPRRIVSGGQTGADRGGLDAARDLGLERGGFCPRGRRAEDGAIPDGYPLVELPTRSYPARTRRNVDASDATVVFSFGAPDRGSALTLRLASAAGKPALALDLAARDDAAAARELAAWLARVAPATLNVAGSRESNAPGIAARVRAVVVRALRGGPPT
jgi:hypothetical protein